MTRTCSLVPMLSNVPWYEFAVVSLPFPSLPSFSLLLPIPTLSSRMRHVSVPAVLAVLIVPIADKARLGFAAQTASALCSGPDPPSLSDLPQCKKATDILSACDKEIAEDDREGTIECFCSQELLNALVG